MYLADNRAIFRNEKMDFTAEGTMTGTEVSLDPDLEDTVPS